METCLTTGELARYAKTTLRTVRFYEDRGLIKPMARKCGGKRIFPIEQAKRLTLALDLRDAGMSLAEIHELFDLKDQTKSAANATCRMTKVLTARICDLGTRIEKLRRLQEELSEMSASIKDCESCVQPKFPQSCESCEEVKEPHLPRALRVLWGK